jgi:lysophospholipase L1-like esterase
VSAGKNAAVERAAATLARSPALRPALRALSEPGLGRVVVVGDSLTADACSWAHILEEVARLSAAGRRTRFVNLGVGGDTTVHLVSRFADVLAASPDVVIAFAGTNDARRHGRAAAAMLVPDTDTHRNLALMCRMAREEAGAVTWVITPPPVLEERVRAAPALVRERVSWRARDVDRKAAVVRAIGANVIDSRAAIAPPLGSLLRTDGLHLTLRGQVRLARLVLRCLSTGGQVRTGR